MHNDEGRLHSTIKQIKYKIPISRSSLCDYSHTCILVMGTIIGVGEAAADKQQIYLYIITKTC